MPSRIKPLAPEVVAAIAAGEVIQRPTHVVKELIENSLDAQATEVTLILKNSGLDLIEVIDNGLGVKKNDLPLAVKPHATSKIVSVDQLHQLTSHGFRGEALASIAQVSQVTVASRLKGDQSGHQILSDFGKTSSVKPLGMPLGTRISVNQLFSKTPVRQQFIKNSSGELSSLMELITAIALGNPQIGFSVKHNQKQLLKVSSGQTLIERTESLFGTEVFSQMIPVEHNFEQLSLSGFISQPSLWNKRPTKQYLFINQRPVKHTQLQKLLHNIINQVQANNLYPMYSLHFQVPPEALDVNIHPQKLTVDLFKFEQIEYLVRTSITPLLEQRPLTYSSVGEIGYMVADDSGQYKSHRFRRGLMNEYHQTSNQKPQLKGEIQQLANLYLLAPTNTGLLLVDQHALHERLLYDDLKYTFLHQKSKLLKKMIPVNVVFDLSPSDKILLDQYKNDLEALGITVELFGNQSYKISRVPEIFADHDVVNLVKEVISQASQDKDLQVDSQTDALLASMACRMAVKAGDPLDMKTRQELIQKLLEGGHPGTCPHGRPVAISITMQELHKLFKRT